MGGVLVENCLSGSEVRHAVIGIGINVGLDTSANPVIASTATSLNVECGEPVSRDTLLRNLLQEMDRLYLSLMDGETPMEEWRGLLDTLGKRVTVQGRGDMPFGLGGSYNGVAEDVGGEGNLLLRLADGRLIALAGGEVTVQEETDCAYIGPARTGR